MCKGKGLWLCIVATLMLTTVGIAQDKDRNPDEQQLGRNWRERAAQDRMEIFVRQTIIPLLQRASKSVGQRYNLDKTTVSELHQSVHESAEALLKQSEGIRTLAAAAHSRNNNKLSNDSLPTRAEAGQPPRGICYGTGYVQWMWSAKGSNPLRMMCCHRHSQRFGRNWLFPQGLKTDGESRTTEMRSARQCSPKPKLKS